MAGRQLKVKVGVLSRTKKEFAMYVKEHQAEQSKTDKMKAEGADAAQIKQQENVTGEAAMMVPDTRRRLERAMQDLQALLEEGGFEEDNAEEVKNAQGLVGEVEALLKSTD